MLPEMMSLRQVATYLHLHPMTVYKLVRRRHVPMTKIGGQWRIRETTFSRWLDQEEHTDELHSPKISSPKLF